MRPAAVAASAAVVAILALALAGCGGSGGSKAAKAKANPSLTHAQFAARANAICRRAKGRAARVAKPTDLVTYARASRTLLALATRVRDDISGLDPPEADRAVIDSYLAALDAPIRELRRVRIAAYKERHGEVVSGAALFKTESARADRIADAYGMTACGSGA
jgi:hypothetical protein